MRSVKELLEVMLKHQEKFHGGLCSWSNHLNWRGLITLDECYVLLDHIDHNRPSKFSSLSAYKNRNNNYYWNKGDIAPRIKWIKEQIEKL